MYQHTGKVDWSAPCQQMSDAMTTDHVATAAMPCITFAVTLKVWERADICMAWQHAGHHHDHVRSSSNASACAHAFPELHNNHLTVPGADSSYHLGGKLQVYTHCKGLSHDCVCIMMHC